MHVNWVSIFGSVEVEKGQVTLVPVPLPPDAQATEPRVPHAYVRSNIEFDQGTVEMQVYLPDSYSRCQIVLGGGTAAEFFAGINSLGAPVGFATLRSGKWEGLGGAGHGSDLVEGWHALKLNVKGSDHDLYLDGVKVASTSFQVARAQLGLLLQSTARVAAKGFRIATQQPVCFVVMQFTDEFNALYSDVIKPTCEEFGYKVVRGDDFYHSGLIIEDISRSIRESTLVIADVTPNNPNVFYEVGFAHGIGKTTILLSDRKRDKLPFDISGFRTIFYDNSIGGKASVEERLRKHLDALGA